VFHILAYILIHKGHLVNYFGEFLSQEGFIVESEYPKATSSLPCIGLFIIRVTACIATTMPGIAIAILLSKMYVSFTIWDRSLPPAIALDLV
jgi:hypothetical protein